ncbi:hypothetical protein TNIN_107971 [Trichonephila inaurata madagascariensis]|uniref:Uncharacterized protein n=1 Tax=Trichonephila inaurata madagascariensis TaxID=2747483 RepID=A0A8X6XYN8_9ARAC|nr:hypothetical protein TNIN_107971 [Trichonephila inaurata madagascariensis]
MVRVASFVLRGAKFKSRLKYRCLATAGENSSESQKQLPTQFVIFVIKLWSSCTRSVANRLRNVRVPDFVLTT